MAAWEVFLPRRRLQAPKAIRWVSNLGLIVFNGFVLRFFSAFGAVTVAYSAHDMGWGLFNLDILAALPVWIAIAGSLIMFDLVIYAQHVLFHWSPWLWRLHRMHHTDLDLDVSSGGRFHTIEIILSMIIKVCVVLVLGPPVAAVILFEIVLNVTSMFNHANIRVPADRILRWFLVTPDMHRVHHSVLGNETNSNFGFSLPWWDRIFGTYRDQPAAGHAGMTIGLEEFRSPRELYIDRLLTQPFRSDAPQTGKQVD